MNNRNLLVKLLIILPTLFLFSNIVLGQLQINWQQSYGGSESEDAQDIVQTEEGFFVIGSTSSTDGEVGYIHGSGDYWIVKTDSMGNLLWEKSFGGSSGEYLYNGFYANNSNDLYLVGVSGSIDGDISYDPYSGESNLWIVRIDNNGNIIWDRKVGSPIGLMYEQYGKPTDDGGVIVSAQVDHPGGDVSTYYGGYDGWIIKLNSNGETDWDFSIGTSASEFIKRVRQTSDGGYIAGLSGQPNGIDGNIDCQCINGSPDAIVYKLDANGNGDWHQCYGGSDIDGIFDILELDMGYMLVGHTRSYDGDLVNSGWHGENDVWLIKTDLTGTILWQKCYGGSNQDFPNAIFQTSEGDFLVFAITHSSDGDVIGNPSNGVYNPSIWVFKINSTGDLLWQQCIGGIATERVNGVTRFSDNNYAVAGEMTYSPSCDVNCSNFVLGSGSNYWAFGLTDITVRIADIPDSHDITVYPNPATSVLNIKLPEYFIIENTTIELIDYNGKTVLQLKPTSVFSPIDIKQLKSGLYLVKIQYDKTLITKRIIVL